MSWRAAESLFYVVFAQFENFSNYILIRNMYQGSFFPNVKELSVPRVRKKTLYASANETVEQLEMYFQESFNATE